MRQRKSAFAIWEILALGLVLMIVIIALGGWLQKQTTYANLAKVQADLKTYAVAIEAYGIDYGEYPPMFTFDPVLGPVLVSPERGLIPLSTPVAYLSDALIAEPFNARQGLILYRGWDSSSNGAPPDRATRRTIYLYTDYDDAFAPLYTPLIVVFLSQAGIAISESQVAEIFESRWSVISPGPDGFYHFDLIVNEPFGDYMTAYFVQTGLIHVHQYNHLLYDPTNGLNSSGDIVRRWQAPLPSPRPNNAAVNWEFYQ